MENDREKVYAENGWLLCDFDGEDGECETCDKQCNPTYYRRTSFEVDEGEYSCADCIEKEIEIWKKFEANYGD